MHFNSLVINNLEIIILIIGFIKNTNNHISRRNVEQNDLENQSLSDDSSSDTMLKKDKMWMKEFIAKHEMRSKRGNLFCNMSNDLYSVVMFLIFGSSMVFFIYKMMN